MAPITIHGNTIDPATAEEGYFPPDASETQWIILQCNKELGYRDQNQLKSLHVRVIRRVADTSFLCEYEPNDLARLQKLDFVDHAIVYHPDFVIDNDLKNGLSEQEKEHEDVVEHDEHGLIAPVAITLHDNATSNGDDVFNAIKEISPEAKLAWSGPDGLCVKVPLKHLPAIAAIDPVAAISSAARKASPFISLARERMGFLPVAPQNPVGGAQPALFVPQHPADRQVIAMHDLTCFDNGQIAGTRLDPATNLPVTNYHRAFVNGAGACRVIKLDSNATGPQSLCDLNGHSTAAAGCTAGNYTAPAPFSAEFPNAHTVIGTAADASLHIISEATSVAAVDYAAALQMQYNAGSSAEIHNHSYGFTLVDGAAQVNYHPLVDHARDNVIYNARLKDLLVVFAAGNDGGRWAVNAAGTRVRSNQINTMAWSKNSLTVGASWNARTCMGYNGWQAGSYHYPRNAQGAAVPYGDLYSLDHLSAARNDPAADPNEVCHAPEKTIAYFSSKGPTYADRFLKPDLVAPGTGIMTTWSSMAQKPTFQNPYGPSHIDGMSPMSGTSFSAPAVSGCAAVLRAAYMRNNANRSPRSSLLRALLINGTDSCDGGVFLYRDSDDPTDGKPVIGVGTLGMPPDPIQGYGRVNLEKSLRSVTRANPLDGSYTCPDGNGLSLMQGNSQWPRAAVAGEQAGATINCVQGNTVTVTLCWDDTAGELLNTKFELRLWNQAAMTHKSPDAIGFYPNITPDFTVGPNFTYDRMLDTLGTVQKVTWTNVPGPVNIAVLLKALPAAPGLFSLAWRVD